MWEKVVRIILRNRIAILIIIALITVFMGVMAIKRLRLDYDLAQLLPETDSTFIEYKEFRKLFGEDAALLVIGTDDSALFELDVFNDFYDLNDSIQNLEGVDTVISIAHIFDLKANPDSGKLSLEPIFKHKPKTQKELDSLLTHIFNLEFYNQIIYTKTDTSKASIIAITLNDSIINNKSRLKFVENLYNVTELFAQKHNIKFHYSGLPYIRSRTMQKVSDELSFFTLLAAIILSIILYLFFKSFRALFVSLLVVFIAVIWVVGTIAIFNYEITILTGLIPPLIIVIGIPNCVFLINKYHQEYKSHGNKIKALVRVVHKIGNATLMTNTTTASGFATFIVTKSAILTEFGVITSINILVVFLLSLLIIPILFSFMPPPKERHTKHLENKAVRRTVAKLVRISIDHRPYAYIVSLIVLIIAIIGVQKIKTTGNVVDDIPYDDPIYVDLLFFEKHFNGVLPLEIKIDTKEKNGVFKDNAKLLYRIKRLQRVIERDSLFSKYLSKPVSLVNAVSYVYQAHRGGNPKYYLLPAPSELSKIETYTNRMKNKQSAFTAFIDTNNQMTRISIQMKNIGTNQIQIIKDSLQPHIDKIFNPDDYDVTLTGTTVVFLKGTNYLIKNLIISLGLAVLLIAGFLTWMFRSFRMIVVSLIPNLFPLLITAAIMGYVGISIKPSTILIFSIAFGISVDDTIHYLAKYRQELKHWNWNIRKSVIIALRETGISMIYTSIVLFFGFFIFSQSSFGGTVALGVLVSITLLFAMLANLVLLPSLLLTLEKIITTKAFKEPLIHIFNEEEDIDLDELKIDTFNSDNEKTDNIEK